MGVTVSLSDKFFVGLDITGFENTGKYRPVSRVTLMADDENAYTAGDDTGLELSASCPHATQEMADALLVQLRGYQYQSFTADAANLDPAAELGDGITVGGLYSTLSRLNDDGNGFPDISAPGEVAMEDEYPSAGPMTQEFNRQLAQTRSLIKKTASEIVLQVEDLDKELGQTLRVAADGVTITNAEGDTLTIDGGQIDASKINTAELDASKIHAEDLVLTGAITWGDLAQDTQGEINGAYSAASTAQNTASSAYNLASAANTTANSANNKVNAWVYPGTTMINGTSIMTGTVRASTLEGGSVSLLNYIGNTVGMMTMTGASSANFAIDLTSYGALRLVASSGAAYIQGGGGAAVGCTSEVSINGGNLRPASTSLSCGTSTWPWSAVYANTSTIQTSDRRQKHDIEDLPEKYITMLDQIPPKRFKLNSGQSGRYHVGFIAQDVEAAMIAAGIDSTEFGGWCKDTDEDGNEIQMLRMEEYLAIIWAKLKQLEGRIPQ